MEAVLEQLAAFVARCHHMFLFRHVGLMMAYSMDSRKRAVATRRAGESVAETARRFEVERSMVREWCRRADRGELEPGKPGSTRPVKLTAADERRCPSGRG